MHVSRFLIKNDTMIDRQGLAIAVRSIPHFHRTFAPEVSASLAIQELVSYEFKQTDIPYLNFK